MWNVLILLLAAAAGDTGSPPERFIATECYGNVLSISCKPGHRIKVLDDFFGVSTRSPGLGRCQYEPGDCTVTNSRHTSVIHRYCEGRQACNSFQVDRRFCGHNQTNYEQVEYKCIPDLEVTDMCSTTSYTTNSGYLATPNFPNEYPPNLDCTCVLEVNQRGTRVQLEATHFIIKHDSPCKDWVEITMSGQMRRLCGAYRSTLFNKSFNLTFHSDDEFGHQGLWLHFSVYPTESNGTLLLSCAQPPPTTASATTVITQTQTLPSSVLSQNVLTSTDIMVPHYLSTRLSTKEGPWTQRYPPDPGGRDITLPETPIDAPIEEWPHGISLRNQNAISENDINKLLEKKMEKRWMEMMKFWFTSHRPPQQADWSRWTTSKSSIELIQNQWSDVDHGDVHIMHPRPPDRPTRQGKGRTEEEQRRKNRVTGIIIISVCVGGILLLVVILTVLLCINKRKRPHITSLERQQRNERLQQRLNSLSFYDSIPLYDSVGRRTGGVARAPPLMPEIQNPQPKTGVMEPPAAKSQQQEMQLQDQHAACRQQLGQDGKSNGNGGPYWATLQLEAESDHDSAIYAELDKQSRGEHSEGVDTPSTLQRRGGEESTEEDFAVQLQNSEEEDIYTHV